MKRTICLFITALIMLHSYSQNNVGIGTASPNSSAILDITSTTKGLLIPRMTTAQRTAIAAPAKGLLLFDTDTNSFWFYNGSSWNSIAGTATLTLPYQQSINSSANGFDITNLGTGAAFHGVSNTAGGIALFGESTNGTAVKGYAANEGSVALFGSSLSGTGVKAYSFTGTALEVIGNLKISGGNTNPTAGAVLTSDAAGNAVWKKTQVAFHEKNDDINTPSGTIVYDAPSKLIFSGEEYDYSNSFTNGTFTAPISGLYHLEAMVDFSLYDINDNIERVYLDFQVSHNGVIGYRGRSMEVYGKNSTSSWATSTVRIDTRLSAGDTISLIGYQKNGTNGSITWYGKFFGHLIFAD